MKNVARCFISNVSKAFDTVLHYHLLVDCMSAHLAKRVFDLLVQTSNLSSNMYELHLVFQYLWNRICENWKDDHQDIN